jgi:hypothetical protein
VRALHYGAMALVAALALGGCSRQPPLQAAAPCVDLAGAPCAVKSAPALGHQEPSLSGRAAGTHRHRSAAAVRHKRVRHHVEEHYKVMSRQPQVAEAKPAATPAGAATPTAGAEPAIPLAKWSAGAPARQPEARPAPMLTPSSDSGGASVQEQVAVATALADRITALSTLPASNGKPDPAPRGESIAVPAPSRLVAVLMVRPGVRAISDLRGRIIAIDERYATAHNKVAAGMAAAGAAEVQLMQGKGTAINRLTNGEVAAAIVALVAPEAAEAFPEIAGYNTFRVPLPAAM